MKMQVEDEKLETIANSCLFVILNRCTMLYWLRIQ